MPKQDIRMTKDDPIRVQANLMLDTGESIKDVLDFVNSQEIPEHYGAEPGAKWLYHSNTIRQWRDKLNKDKSPLDEPIDWHDKKTMLGHGISEVNIPRIRSSIGWIKSKIIKAKLLWEDIEKDPELTKKIFQLQGTRLVLRNDIPHEAIKNKGDEQKQAPDPEILRQIQSGEFTRKMAAAIPQETYRYAYWCDYILNAAGDSITKDSDLWIITKNFVRRHRLKEIDSDANMNDLEDWLDFRPWASMGKIPDKLTTFNDWAFTGKRETDYQYACLSGAISPIKYLNEGTYAHRDGSTMVAPFKIYQTELHGLEHLALNLMTHIKGYFHLLPSQQLEITNRFGVKATYTFFNLNGLRFCWELED